MIPFVKRNVRWLLVTLAFMVAAAAIGYALFQARQDVNNNTLSTGAGHSINVTPASNIVSLAGMQQGSTAFGFAAVTTDGAGQFELRSLATNADGKNLRDFLVLTVKEGLASANCNAAGFGSGGIVKYTGPLGSEPELALFTMPSVTSFGLCFKVELPATAPSTLANATTTATFGFIAKD